MKDTFPGQVEAFPTVKETANVVSTHFITQIVPLFGLPIFIQLDKEATFVSKVT